jgi:hypothetical protein
VTSGFTQHATGPAAIVQRTINQAVVSVKELREFLGDGFSNWQSAPRHHVNFTGRTNIRRRPMGSITMDGSFAQTNRDPDAGATTSTLMWLLKESTGDRPAQAVDQIVERQSGRGSLGCTNYPKCKTKIWKSQ